MNEGLCCCNQVKMRSTGCDWALNPVAGVLIRKGRLGTPREQMGRCHRRRRQNLQWLIPKPGIPRSHQTLGKARRFLPEVLAHTLTGILGLQNWERIHFSSYSSFRNLKHHWCPCFSQAQEYYLFLWSSVRRCPSVCYILTIGKAVSGLNKLCNYQNVRNFCWGI